LVMVMPQFIDLKIINKSGFNPYQEFFQELGNEVQVLDITKYMDKKFTGDLYAEDVYGGHFSEFGNKVVAEKLEIFLKNQE